MQTNTPTETITPSDAEVTQNPGPQFVDAEELLKLLFPPESRPNIRWLRERQKQRDIPFLKLGRLVFFIPAEVHEALTKKQTVSRN